MSDISMRMARLNAKIRIAELEQELSNAETMGDKALAIHALEHEAKGIDDYADGVTMDILKVAMKLHAERLRKQAKALGEQK
jgi:hypothetical protein